MKRNFFNILKISRFKFWVYLWGTYILGLSIGARNLNELNSLGFLLQIVYFTFPANFIIYGVNDLSDSDTDEFNFSKKGEYEYKLNKKDIKLINYILLVSLSISLLALLLSRPVQVQILYLIFLILGICYSIKPFRFKAIPILDSLSNFLYAVPGLIGYYETSQALPDLKVILLIICWTSSMHLFSAIPDIVADKKAKLTTTAVLLGKRFSLILCTILWGIFFVGVFFSNILKILSVFTAVYFLIPLLILFNPRVSIDKVYKIFPYINFIIGLFAFIIMVLRLF